jgi:hypothetical protein
LNKQQFLEDMDMMEYLFDYAYSGRKFWEDRGVDFKGFFKNQRDLAKDYEWFSVEKLMNRMEKHFSGIVDNHLVINGSRQLRFKNHKKAHFADILIRKGHDEFIVLNSLIPEVNKSSKYTGKTEHLFPTLSPEGEEHYLVGTLSWESLQELTLNFDNKDIKVNVHQCRISEFETIDKKIFDQKKIEGLPIVSVRSFSGEHDVLDDFTKSSKKLRKEKILLYNLLNNGGGSSDYGEKFIENLNDVAQWRRTGGGIESAPTIQKTANTPDDKIGYNKYHILEARKMLKNPDDCSYMRWYVAPPYDKQKKGNFKGKLIVLTNRWVASAGESAVAYCKSVPDVVFIGENTNGMGMFGNATPYVLPNSQMTLYLCRSLFIMPDFEEGVGFMPNYWLDTNKPLEEVTRWIKEGKDYQFKLK